MKESLAERTRTLEQLSVELEGKDRALEEVNSSLSWIVTAPLRALSRVFSGTRRLLKKIVIGQTYWPELSPGLDLVAAPESGPRCWKSTGVDPQFSVRGPWPLGPARLRIHVQTEAGSSTRARLYIDRGSGYAESDSVDLGKVGTEQAVDIPLDRRTVALRLDPLEEPAAFRILSLELRRTWLPERMIRGISIRMCRFVRRVRHGISWRRQAFLERHRRPALAPAPVPAERTSAGFQPPPPVDPYQAWREANEWTPRREEFLRKRLSALGEHPVLSVLMPTFNPPLDCLVRAFESLLAQVDPRWELCIADDASTNPAVRSTLLAWQARDPRIRVTFRAENGNISRATNTAAEMARGDFLVFLDQDDELTPDALGEIALHLAEAPEADLLYSDDDKIDATGRHFAPQFKPEWSPELLLSYMYLSHVFVLRRSLFHSLGGLRVGFEGSQDYDLALRASEKVRKAIHIPKILYHWRVLPDSTASSGAAKPASFEAGRRAVQEALDRRGTAALAHHPRWARDAGCGIFSHRFADEGPSVTIVIPTRNRLDVLEPCITSIERNTRYKNYSIAIVDNSSDDPSTLEYLRKTPHQVLRIESPGGKFSFAAVMNEAVRRVQADCVLLLNNDTEIRTPEWLSQMVGYLGLPEVGAVGARLLFPDGRIQHAGIVHGYYKGMAGPAFKLHPGADAGYLSYAFVARNYSAVTAACLLVRRQEFLTLGGFDEKNFAVAYNDVDFCYRMEATGRRIVYCPTAELTHHEGYSRGKRDNPREILEFRKRYGRRRDPYYNPNLSLEDETFGIRSGTLAPGELPPIRTLMCAFNLNWEGAPYSQFELTARLKDRGVLNPIVYSPSDGPLRSAYEGLGIPVHLLPHPLAGVTTGRGYEEAIREFAGKIAQWKAELVYGNTLKTFYAIDAARTAGVPSIWNPRESEPWHTYFDDFPAPIARCALECFQYPYAVVFVSDATRRNCEALNSRRNFRTIHNGLNRSRIDEARRATSRETARKKLGIDVDTLAVLLMGTVCDRKGQLDLVEAIRLLEPRDLNRLQCFIVGDRPSAYSQRLHEAAQTLPEEARRALRIVPETSEPFTFYSAADLFVCTSRVESFPRVILEAMAFGLPIVSTPVFGIAEQVQEDLNALLYPPGDVQTLASKLGALLRDDVRRSTFGANSVAVLEGLTSFDEMADAYSRIFREAWMTSRGR